MTNTINQRKRQSIHHLKDTREQYCEINCHSQVAFLRPPKRFGGRAEKPAGPLARYDASPELPVDGPVTHQVAVLLQSRQFQFPNLAARRSSLAPHSGSCRQARADSDWVSSGRTQAQAAENNRLQRCRRRRRQRGSGGWPTPQVRLVMLSYPELLFVKVIL